MHDCIGRVQSEDARGITLGHAGSPGACDLEGMRTRGAKLGVGLGIGSWTLGVDPPGADECPEPMVVVRHAGTLS